jgi:hypothetical protein
VSGVHSFVAEAPDGGVVYHRGSYRRTVWLEAATYKFVFIAGGRYDVELGDNAVGVAPGQFVVLNPHTRHRHLGLSGAKLLVEINPAVVAEAAAALGTKMEALISARIRATSRDLNSACV